MTRIGLVSDTHGLLRPEAIAYMAASSHIIYAGDIGAAEILDTLNALAPVTVVRGTANRLIYLSYTSRTSAYGGRHAH